MREEEQKVETGRGGVPALPPLSFFFFARICQLATKKEMKMIASQDSKIVIQSIRSITGHLPDGKKASCSFKPSRLGVLLISYVTFFKF